MSEEINKCVTPIMEKEATKKVQSEKDSNS